MNRRELAAFYAHVGMNVRRARQSSNVTQEALAKAIHVSRASIVNTEAGRQHPPLDRLADISTALDYPLWRLIR